MKSENRFLVWWCGKPWLIATYIIGIIILVMTIISWGEWDIPRRLIALLSITLPIHVFEENSFPDGFHFMLNTVQKSERPNAGPMNRLSDMVSNFGGELIFVLMTFLGGNIVTSVFVVIFGIGECIVHTIFGFVLRKKLRNKGMNHIYGPGLLTSYLVLLPVSVYGIIWLSSQGIGLSHILGGIVFSAAIIICLIRIPISVLGKYQPEYEFESAGYFQKYEEDL